MTAARLTLDLDERSYDIIIGSGLLAVAPALIVPVLASKRVIIISDSNVAPLYAHALQQALVGEGIAAHTVTIPAGEDSKSFAMLETLMEQLLALTPDRKTTLIALGGGVVGDLVGFAASILLRGVPFIQIPTSLLAQVDSSVGGKTAINARLGKNLIGSFYQPKLVLADLDTLATLDARHLRAGYGEMLKYGLIMDAEFYRWCLANAKKLLAGDNTARAYAIEQCCRMKAEIVGGDEREAGRRALLNFGHTFAHALEAELNFDDRLFHGEAVALGMVMACRLSNAMGLIEGEVEQELTMHLRDVGLPTSLARIAHTWNAERIAAHFAADKKAEAGALTFVVLDAIGMARVATAVNPVLAHRVVEAFVKEAPHE